MERRKKEKAASENKETATKPENIGDTPVSVNLMREYVFQNLDKVIEAAHGLNNLFQGFSALYKDEKNNTYSPGIHEEETSPEDFNRVCNMLSEYGKGSPFSLRQSRHILKEHGVCILPSKALTHLTQI